MNRSKEGEKKKGGSCKELRAFALEPRDKTPRNRGPGVNHLT